MADLAHVVDSFTGDRVGLIPVDDFPWSELLSAGAKTTITVPLGGAYTREQLRALIATPWRYIIVFERDDVAKFGGYILSEPRYHRGQSTVTVELGDIWSLWEMRVMTGRDADNIVQWEQDVNGTLAAIGGWHLMESWNRAIIPSPRFPVTLGPSPDTAIVTRPFRGYEMKYLAEVFENLMAEGLDIYFRPRWSASKKFEWYYRAGVAWQSGIVHDFDVTAEKSPVSNFDAQGDGKRMANNAIRVGEGSEKDMLVRSDEDEASPLPLLEQISLSKSVSDIDQLQSMATQDIYTFGRPVSQWTFDVDESHPVGIGDKANMKFSGDPWMPDGIFPRRVVRLDGSNKSSKKTVTVQRIGGA
jgi:hypothetical protein